MGEEKEGERGQKPREEHVKESEGPDMANVSDNIEQTGI
jgi:hypothetical protein